MTILAAVDETVDHAPQITVAHDLAKQYGDTLDVVHVIPQDEADSHLRELRQFDQFTDFSIDQEKQSAAQIAERVARETIEEDSSVLVNGVGRVGDPAEKILEVTDDHNARYLVIGGSRRSPTGKAIFGSTTQSVLLQTNHPVVVAPMD
jgi:nucleotide-binding universal stress UspA family protein